MRMYVILALAIAMAALTQAATAQTELDGALSLTNLRVTPMPVTAGSTLNISFQLFNSYQGTLNDVNVQLESSSPLLNVSPSHNYVISAIGTGVYGGVSYNTFVYTVKVPSFVAAGAYTIDVVANYEGSYASLPQAGESTMPITLYVYGAPSVAVNANSGGEITPGSAFSLDLSAVNAGTDTADNVTLSLLNSSSFGVIGATTFHMGNIDASASAGATAQLQAARTITPGVHELPMEISYTSPVGLMYNRSIDVPLSVQINQPVLAVSVASAVPQQLTVGSNQTLSVLVQNVGDGPAENVSVQFVPGQNIGMAGSVTRFFLGEIPAGGSVTRQVFVTAGSNVTAHNATLLARVNYSYANYANTTSVVRSLPIGLAAGALFNVTAVSDSLQPGSTYQPVTFSLHNYGNEVAQGVSVSAQTNYPITFIDPYTFVGNIAPGQTVNVTFYASVNQLGNPGSYQVTLYEQWKQPNGAPNQQYSGSSDYLAVVQPAGSAQAGGGQEYSYYVAILVIIVLALVYVRLKRRGGAVSSKQRKG